MKEKFPIEMVVNKTHTGMFKAATSIGIIVEKTRNIRHELGYVEVDYAILIKSLRDSKPMYSHNRKIGPRLFWRIGDDIFRFLERLDDMGFYLFQQNHTLARDTGMSESSIKKILAFRKRFQKLSLIDPTLPWTNYRDNKVAIK